MSDSALQPASVTAGHKTTVQDVISNLCATVPDYPEPGVLFQDLTPVFADGPAMRLVIDALLGAFPEAGFDAVAGVEPRGFLLAGLPLMPAVPEH